MPEIAPSGKPLPPLVDLEIYAHTKEFSHLTQDMGDRVLQIAYDDVYVGASLHVTVEDPGDLTPEFYEGLRKSYPERLYIPMKDAARAGKISSKILAEWPISRQRRLQEARQHRKAAKENKKRLGEFLAEQDPVTRAALESLHADAKAASKEKKRASRKRPKK